MLELNKSITQPLTLPETEAPSVHKWNDLQDSDHLVQFYESDEFLLQSLSEYVIKGLHSGDACVVVATPSHLFALEQSLRQHGQDLPSNYLAMDARETLSRFMVDGEPDAELFKRAIGKTIDRAGEGGKRVRIYGEMVALLWSDSNYDAAIRLEQLWNEISKTHRFTLCCAYPIHEFDSSDARSLTDVCAHHSVVVPAESYARATSIQDRLTVITGLQQKAKALEQEIAERKQIEIRLRASEKRHKQLKKQLQQQLKERNELLQREQEARREAQRANRMKDEFLANVSHELRTPLTSLFGWARLLRSANLDPGGVSRALECIERSVLTQRQLVEDLLDVSGIVAGKLQLNRTSVAMESVMESVLETFKPAAELKNISIKIHFESRIPQIQGDPIRLQQIISNLLSNAIKFTPKGGNIDVRLAREDEKIRISVEDTGEGIVPKFLPYVFDRFRQADSTTTRKHGGLGLGLTIARHLISLHGGTIHAHSDGKGKGSTFIVSLPIG